MDIGMSLDNIALGAIISGIDFVTPLFADFWTALLQHNHGDLHHYLALRPTLTPGPFGMAPLCQPVKLTLKKQLLNPAK